MTGRWPEDESVKVVLEWFSNDKENRKEATDVLLSSIRYSLLTPQEVGYVLECDAYKQSDGDWRDLVVKAEAYHQLPTHLKVSDTSDQNRVRIEEKTPFLTSSNETADGWSSSYYFDANECKQTCWLPMVGIKMPPVTGKISFAIEVNNFLITCSKFGENQEWQVFDPRTLAWSRIPNMPTPRDEFAMVYHDKHLYVLGGSVGEQKSVTDTVDMYSFETNSWSSTGVKLPVAVKNHSACVLNDAIYICGGEIDEDDGTSLSARLDRLDLRSQTWEGKAAMSNTVVNHKMCVLTITKRQAVVVLNQRLKITYYHPDTNQWSAIQAALWKPIFPIKKGIEDLQWGPESVILVEDKENIVYFLNLRGKELLNI